MLISRAIAWSRGVANVASPPTLLFFSMVRIIPSSAIAAVVGAGMLASGYFGSATKGSVAAFMVGLPLLAIITLIGGYMKGMGRASLSSFFQIGGVLIVANVLLYVAHRAAMPFTGSALTWYIVAAMFITCIPALILITRDYGKQSEKISLHPGSEQLDQLSHGEITFTIIAAAAFLLQAGTFVLAAPFLAPESLGLVRGAERLALIVSFPVLAITPVISPQIARLARTMDIDGLRKLIRRSTVQSLLIAAPPLLFFLLFPHKALALMGPAFAEASGYLQIMALANLAVVVTGPAAVLLNMGGGERAAMWINTVILFIGAVMIAVLSLNWGASGFVAAYTAIAVVRSFVIVIASRRHMLRPVVRPGT